jgi:hypothetical protein
MLKKLARLFILSAGVLLFLVAAAKLISSFGTATVLRMPDPILSIPFRQVFRVVGLLELIITAVCFFSKNIELRVGLVAGLATTFVLYRLGLLWVGYHKPCNCLGSMTSELHISSAFADTIMKIILAYLLIGSYAALFWLFWRQRRKVVSASFPAQ